MPRVNQVKKAQKSPGKCLKCDRQIKKGDPYIFWKFRYGGKRIRCGQCPRPRQSELTSSDKLSRCYAAGESIGDAIATFRDGGDLEDLKDVLDGSAGEIREVADEYRDSASNVESGMNGNRMPICDELEEKADNLESKADEIESASSDLEEFDEEEAKDGIDEEELAAEIDGWEEAKDKSAFIEEHRARIDELKEGEVKKLREDWIEDQASKVEEYTDISPEG